MIGCKARVGRDGKGAETSDVASRRADYDLLVHSVGGEVESGIYIYRHGLVVGRKGGGHEHENGVVGSNFHIGEVATAKTVDVEAKKPGVGPLHGYIAD